MHSQEEKTTITTPCEERDNRGELWKDANPDLREELRKIGGEKSTWRNGENMPCPVVMSMSLQETVFYDLPRRKPKRKRNW